MARRNRVGVLLVSLGACMAGLLAGQRAAVHSASSWGGYSEVTVEITGRTATVVFHALDRDGYCDAAAFGGASLHPVLTGAKNDTMLNPATGLPNPRETVDFVIDSGDGIITAVSGGAAAAGARAVTGVPTYSTFDNALSAAPIKAFPPLVAGVQDECQAWVTVSAAPGSVVNLLVVVHDDLGDLGFDRVLRFVAPATEVDLTYRWTLVTWPGPDGVPTKDALSGTGAAGGGDNILSRVSVVYGWDAAAGWTAFFPAGEGVAGVNNLAALHTGQAYWVAIAGPEPLRWRIGGTH